MIGRIRSHRVFAAFILISLISALPATTSVSGADLVPPETSAELHGREGSNGWNTSSVNVTLLAVDGGSGVNRTNYSIDGGVWKEYSGEFQLSGDGVHYINFYSVDNASNTETTRNVSVRIDSGPPSLSLGQADGSTVGSSNFRVTWTSSDAISGIDFFEVLSDGALFSQPDNTSSGERVTNLADGWHNVTVRAYDKAGNFAEKTVSFRVWADQSSPPDNTALLVAIAAAAAAASAAAIYIIRKRR